MAELCGMSTIQYSARSPRLSVQKLFTSSIRSSLVSCDSTVDGDGLNVTEWCQRYLQCCQPASDVAQNLGIFLVRSVQPGRLIQMVEMKTKNSVEGILVVNFRQYVIIAEL